MVVHRSRRYVAWLQDAGWQLRLQRPGKIQGPVAISIAAGRPDQRRRDLDNVAGKANSDLLTARRHYRRLDGGVHHVQMG